MSKRRAALLVFALALALTTPWVTAQTCGPNGRAVCPSLADYFTEIPGEVIDAGYAPLGTSQPVMSEDLNGDGYQDIVVLGHVSKYGNLKYDDVINVPQPGRVFLGDGNGHFVAAPANLFPVDTLLTVDCNEPLFADFNADGRPDMFIACGGWDASPWPGEQDRLYLSQPKGGWRDATANLPLLNDKPASSAIGDISGRGLTDIYVGNSYFQDDPRGLPYFLLNSGTGQFRQTSTNIPTRSNQLLNNWRQPFTGSALVDLNDDGLPELIVTADNKDVPDKRLHSIILWNRAGVFVDTDKTELPTTEVFGNAHIDHNESREMPCAVVEPDEWLVRRNLPCSPELHRKSQGRRPD